MFHPDLTVKQAIRLAVYLVSKANQYIDKCGGGPDITTLNHDGNIETLSQTNVSEMCYAMESVESQHLLKIITEGSQSV
jgi:hypothetical protein